jgi:hypothetical protein
MIQRWKRLDLGSENDSVLPSPAGDAQTGRVDPGLRQGSPQSLLRDDA